MDYKRYTTKVGKRVALWDRQKRDIGRILFCEICDSQKPGEILVEITDEKSAYKGDVKWICSDHHFLKYTEFASWEEIKPFEKKNNF